MSQIRNAILSICCFAAVSGTAHAEDQAVLHRLSSNGRLSGSQAKQLVAKVGQRLARAADTPPTIVDPLRVALSQAMLGTPVATDQISAAKVRLKLYAGLNEFILESLFSPRPGAIASCMRDVSLPSKDCEALVAAAGKTTVANAKRQGSGPATSPMMMAAAAPAAQPMAAAGGARFGGRFESGYQQQAPASGGYAMQQQPMQQQRFQQQAMQQPMQQPMQQQRFQQQPMQQQPMAAPMQQQRFQAAPAAAAPAYVAAAPAPNPALMQDAAARKAAYQAQREAYMAKQKADFEERRAKLAGANAPPPDAPAPAAAPAAAPQPVASAKASKAAAAPAEPETGLDADMKGALGEAAAAPPSSTAKAGLEGEFLDGLLDDPLGGKGGKKK